MSIYARDFLLILALLNGFGCCLFGAESRREAVLRQLTESRSKYTTPESWAERRIEVREGFLRGAGLWPLPARTALQPIVHSRRSFGDYVVENIALQTMPGLYCTGNLYRPLDRKQPGPGVLCPHGHFQPLGRMRAEHQIRCAHLARMGATVFSYSMVGWQDSQQTTHDDPLVLALQTWNSIRALDFICELPEVDPTRIGVTGASGGGTQTLFLAALDDRVRVSAPVVIVYPWSAPDGCKCEGGMPVMQATHTNAIELAACVAPRPQLLISCGGDETRDFPSVGFPFVQHVYEAQGAKSSVENEHFATEGHDYGPSKRRAMYRFFAKHLGLTNLDEDLTKIVIEIPAAMAVFNGEHPLPSGAAQGSQQVANAFNAAERPVLALPSVQVGTQTQVEGEDFFFTAPGFDHVGKPVLAADASSGRLRITVKDAANQQLTPCRLNVVGPDGNFYQPSSDQLTPYALTGDWPAPGAWGNRKEKAPYRYLGRFFYSTGSVGVAVPPGQVRVEVWKGYEYQPVTQTLDVKAGDTKSVAFEIARTADVAQHGYYSGDFHLHIPRGSERDESTIFDLLAAEDIRFGCILGYNEPAGPYTGDMQTMASPQLRGLGRSSIFERNGFNILSGQEYRSSTYGHLLVFHRDDLLFPDQKLNANNWPIYGEIGRDTRTQGGYTIHAHGGYGQEIYADAALGTVDAVELLQFGVYRGIGLEDWYHMLNTGYRFPCVAASDWPACRFFGDCRTYVHQPQKPDFSNWLKGAVQGRSFVTTGPLVLIEVDGKHPGDRIEKNGAGTHLITVNIRVRSEVAPVKSLDLIINGQVVLRQEVPSRLERSGWYEFTRRLPLTQSSWLAARAYSITPGGQPDAEAHTNPVFVYLDGRAPYLQASLDAWVAKIDAQIAIHRKRDFAEKSRVLDYFQQARDWLLEVRQRGGLRADDDPAKQAAHLAAPSAQSLLARDASASTPSETDLNTFLQPLSPKTPGEALASFEMANGFQMQLVAAEPLVFDPVAATFDEDGNLYVCEMQDYPYKPAPGKKPLGSVRKLRDIDGDGRFDRSTLFAGELLWAAGIVPWKGGVFVAAAPDIWYLKDTDGDDRADIRYQAFTGFGTENQQAMVNNLTWWDDHQIYGSTAGNGGDIRPGADFQAVFPHADPNQGDPWSVNGQDFRFDPVTGEFEALSGTVQFGTTFDDWGNRFLCSESQPLYHVVLPHHLLARNPYLAVPSAMKNIALGPIPVFRISPVERWRQIRSSRRIANQERSAESPGASHHVVDAAAGVTIYRGGAYPPEYYGTVFIADGQNNLVHRRQLINDGISFQSKRIEEGTEFVRSSDVWFRPVNFVNAPDGTLYCLDMGREVLESIHIPLDVVRHLDLTNGRNHGRIYRMAPPGFRPSSSPRQSVANGASLVEALQSKHGWWRDTSMRLIFEGQDKSLVPALEQMAMDGPTPQSRHCALWSLYGLDALEQDVVLRVLRDEMHPAVIENAIRLSQLLLRNPRSPPARARNSDKIAAFLASYDHPDRRVRFQLAFALGETTGLKAVDSLARLGVNHADDVWMRTAILSSVANQVPEMLDRIVGDEFRSLSSKPTCVSLMEKLAEVAGVRNHEEEIRRVIDCLATAPTLCERPNVQQQLAAAVGRGQKRSGKRLNPAAFSAAGAAFLTRLFDTANATATRAQAAETERTAAIQILSCSAFDMSRATLTLLLDLSQPQGIQIAAVHALADYPDALVGDILLEFWRRYPPDVRAEALTAMFAREERTLQLLAAARRGEISIAELDIARRELICKHRNDKIRSLGAELYADGASESRADILRKYRPALSLPGDAMKGKALFETHCASCHLLNGKGYAIGPNLASSPSRDPETLLAHVLDPNQYVLPTYVQYSAIDKQGRVFIGMIAAQTATSITLKREKDAADTILRADLDELISMGKSLMPEGIEKIISPGQMADLLTYLVQNAGPAPANPNRERDFGTLPGLVEPNR